MPNPTQAFLSIGRLLATWDHLRSSFWFVPTIMAVGAIVVSFAMTTLDAAIDERVSSRTELVYHFGPEGARAILSAIASSMITVAGLTFSITMLTLQLASSQFGPRLLRNFLRDRGNQIVLGTFISTFVYCLLVLRTVKGVEGASFVPHLSVAVGVFLAIISLAILIYFIHHTAHSIRIETLLATLAGETRAAIDRLHPETPRRETAPGIRHTARDLAHGDPIRPRIGGYIQSVDIDALLFLARRHDLLIALNTRPGSFVTRHDRFMSVVAQSPLSSELADALREALVIGDERTPDQDLQFLIRRVVEIAQRSLSPGVNDPTTALYCIDRLSEAFVELATRDAPSRFRFDEDGQLRVITEPLSFENLARSSFAAVVRYAGSDDDVLDGLAGALDRILEVAGPGEYQGLAELRHDIRKQLLKRW